jgi:hypothetical protein
MDVGSIENEGRAGPPRAAAVAGATSTADLAEAERQMTRRYGNIGALLFVGAAVSAIPSTLLLVPQPPAGAYLIVAAAIVTGLACYRLPWERLPRELFHLFVGVAIVLVALAGRYVDLSYELYFLFIAVYTAYVFPTWEDLLPHLLLISAALLVPALGRPGVAQEVLRQALLVLPAVVIVGGAVAYLRLRLEDRERAYLRFAEETFALAARISASARYSHRGGGTATSPSLERPAGGGPPRTDPEGRELVSLLAEGRLLWGPERAPERRRRRWLRRSRDLS